MTTVQLGSLLLAPSAVSGWFFNRLVDWYSVPESKGAVRERPVADGAFGISRDYRSALPVTVEGGFLGSDRATVLAAKRSLSSVASGTPLTVTVTDEDGPTTRVVSVRRIDLHDDHGGTFFSFAVDMIAPDPNRYGPEVSVSSGLPSSGSGIAYPIVYPFDYGTAGDPGRVTVSNVGTFETFSTFEVAGGLTGGFELKDISSGRRLRFEREVPLGSTVVLNARTGRAYLDVPANDVSGFLTVREWWSVPAGVSQEIQFSALGGVSGVPSLTARTRPAY